MPCVTTQDCPGGQQVCRTVGYTTACYSTANPVDLAELADAGLVGSDGGIGDASTQTVSDGAADSTADATMQTGSDGSTDGGSTDSTVGADATGSTDSGTPADATPKTDSNVPDTGIVSNPCTKAQTLFNSVGQGDSNPNFTSGIGVRTATQMLVFSGESTAVDAGADAAPQATSHVWVQAFDPISGDAVDAAVPIFPGSGVEPYIQVLAGAVDPSGDIVVVYDFNDRLGSAEPGGNGWVGAPYAYGGGTLEGGGLYAEFLSLSTDGGVAGLQLVKNVHLDSSLIYGQPHATWLPAAQAFAVSWQYYDTSRDIYVALAKFGPNGNSASGGEAPVSPGAYFEIGGAIEYGAAAPFGTLLGVVFATGAYGSPGAISVLDPNGLPIANSPITPVDNTSRAWLALGGVSQGFAYLYDNGSGTSELFVPVSIDAGIAEVPDAGFSGFTFPESVSAAEGRMANDDTGGAGGAGIALMYTNGVSFAYINADGVTHTAPQSVLSPLHTYQSGDLEHIAQFGGSFVISDYSSAENRTYIAASGCSQ